MSKYPIEKYNIIIHQHPKYNTVETIGYSTYAGKVVKGKAICHADDAYDEEKGIKLAVARCAAKIAEKRKKRAAKLMKRAAKQVEEAQEYLSDMTNYYMDACVEVAETQKTVNELLETY